MADVSIEATARNEFMRPFNGVILAFENSIVRQVDEAGGEDEESGNHPLESAWLLRNDVLHCQI